MITIDINADLGESYGTFRVGDDKRIMDVITSANIACGFHAGDYNVISESLNLALESNVAVGAHPGYPDLFGFGRREMMIDSEEVYRIILYQLGAISGFCKVKGISLQHVKPHGALYNVASRNKEIAEAIARAVRDFDRSLILFGLCKSELISAGKKFGLHTANEAFADRTYTKEGQLTPRGSSQALLTDTEAILNQVRQIIINQQVTSIDGVITPLQADTICFHGDGEASFEKIIKVREFLSEIGVQVKKVGE